MRSIAYHQGASLVYHQGASLVYHQGASLVYHQGASLVYHQDAGKCTLSVMRYNNGVAVIDDIRRTSCVNDIPSLRLG